MLSEAKGEDALTGEQMARWDSLHADLARERRAACGPAPTVTQFESEELGQVEFTIKQGYHEKRECPLWIVQLGSRVSKPTFKELKIKATMLGGWYSSFKKSDAGFQFLSEEAATKFTKLLEGDADRQEILAGRKERKEQTAAERLHELGDNLLGRADQTLATSEASLQNTARRADIQVGVRGGRMPTRHWQGRYTPLRMSFLPEQPSTSMGFGTRPTWKRSTPCFLSPDGQGSEQSEKPKTSKNMATA